MGNNTSLKFSKIFSKIYIIFFKKFLWGAEHRICRFFERRLWYNFHRIGGIIKRGGVILRRRTPNNYQQHRRQIQYINNYEQYLINLMAYFVYDVGSYLLMLSLYYNLAIYSQNYGFNEGNKRNLEDYSPFYYAPPLWKGYLKAIYILYHYLSITTYCSIYIRRLSHYPKADLRVP